MLWVLVLIVALPGIGTVQTVRVGAYKTEARCTTAGDKTVAELRKAYGVVTYTCTQDGQP